MRSDSDTIYRRGEESLCGITFLGMDDQPSSHDAMHHRSEVVAQAAIDSSRRGDGRFLEGDAVITTERGVSFLGTMARAVQGGAGLRRYPEPGAAGGRSEGLTG